MEAIVNDMVQKWKIEDAADRAVLKIVKREPFSVRRVWLVGKLLTEKQFNKGSLIHCMKKLWRTKEEVAISVWESSDRFLFSFRTEHDRNQVMRGSPWSFDNTLLLLSATDGKEDPLSVKLEAQGFWIRVRGLLPCLLSRAMGRKIGSFFGDVVEVDPKFCGEGSGSFLRIRVNLDVSVPLWRWVMLDIEGDGETKLKLEYEDLPFFCFFCGRLTHFSSCCPLAREGIITEHHFGRWKTSVKNVFSIDPCGEPTRATPSSIKKNSGWRMKAPDPALSGNVRTRHERDELDPGLESDMMVDQAELGPTEVSPVSPKRRRVTRDATTRVSDSGSPSCNSLLPTPIPLEIIPSAIPAKSDLTPQENVSDGGMAHQELGMGTPTARSFLNNIPVEGTFLGISGTILNFQSPLGLNQTTLDKSSPTIILPLTRGRPKTSKPKKKAQPDTPVKPSDFTASSSLIPQLDPHPAPLKIKLSNEPQEAPLSSATVGIPATKFLQLCGPPGAQEHEAINDSSPLLGGSGESRLGLQIGDVGGVPKSVCSTTAMGIREQVFPSLPSNRPEDLPLNELHVTLITTDVTSIPPSLSCGRTPNRSSVMGPVSTHHKS